MPGCVVRNNHVFVLDLFEYLHVPVHVHYPFVRPHLLKLVTITDDVAEVNQENFLPLTESSG